MKRIRYSSRQSDKYEDFIFHQRKICRLHFELDLPLFPFCFEDEIRKTSAWFEAQQINYVMLVAMEEGENIFRIHDKSYRIGPGKILFIPEFSPIHFSNHGYFHRYVLELRGGHSCSICNSLQLKKPEVFHFGSDNSFLEAMKNLGKELDTDDPERFTALMAECYRLLTVLALHRIDKAPGPTLLPQILRTLETDLARRISIADLCAESGLNKATLTRMVKRATGMTPIQYRAKWRIERALPLLAIPQITIKEIAYQLGYCNQFYFAEEFKRLFGITPTEYRHYQKSLPREK